MLSRYWTFSLKNSFMFNSTLTIHIQKALESADTGIKSSAYSISSIKWRWCTTIFPTASFSDCTHLDWKFIKVNRVIDPSLRSFIRDIGTQSRHQMFKHRHPYSHRMAIPRTACVRLNCLRSAHRCRTFPLLTRMRSGPFSGLWVWRRGTDVVLHCPIHRLPYGTHGLSVLYGKTIEWLLKTCAKM